MAIERKRARRKRRMGRPVNTIRSLTSAQRAALVRKARNRKLPDFSSRELKFIRLACGYEEFNTEEVALYMDISYRTVDDYRSQVCKKAGVKSRAGLVLMAVKWGLVKL